MERKRPDKDINIEVGRERGRLHYDRKPKDIYRETYARIHKEKIIGALKSRSNNRNKKNVDEMGRKIEREREGEGERERVSIIITHLSHTLLYCTAY
jgi:hypothetical protein